jgi:hypothetical protein
MWEMWTCAPPYEELTKECHFSVLHFLDQVVKGARPPLDDDTAVSKAFPPHLRQLLRRYIHFLWPWKTYPAYVDFRSFLIFVLDGMFVFLK